MDITPQAIRQRAIDAHVSLSAVLDRANIRRSTFWRWENNEKHTPYPVTLRKLQDALTEIEREKRLRDIDTGTALSLSESGG